MKKSVVGIIFVTCFILSIYVFSNSRDLEHTVYIPSTKLPPLCSNLLENIANGRWIRKISFLSNNLSSEYKDLIKKEYEVDSDLNEFRIKRGLHTRLWRDDGKCGYKNLQEKPLDHAWGANIGGWCDATKDKPCCSNKENGVCGIECECSECVDMRKKLHAEVSEWIPFDSDCVRQNYTAVQSCDVIKRFSEIQFIGDSFTNKMFRALILTLRSDPTYGAMYKSHNDRLKQLCVGMNQFYWSECKVGSQSLANFIPDNRTLCDESFNKLSYKSFWNKNFAPKYLETIKKLTGKIGSIIILSVGLHMQCNSTLTKKFIGPGIKYMEEYYQSRNISDNEQRWPHIIYMYPDSPGLLKPPQYRHAQGKINCDKFAVEMRLYCNEYKIAVLDFRKLTEGVHSFDGTHRGLGGNIMKVQLLLNYLDYFSELACD